MAHKQKAVADRGDAAGNDRSRARMVRAAAELLQRRGFAGTSLADILARAQAPRGSLYHHFPGGKGELVVAAIELASDIFDAQLANATDAPTLAAYLETLTDLSERDLIASDFEAACPVAAAALDVPQAERAVVAASAAAFDRWAATIARGIDRFVSDPDRAGAVATLATSALLGATTRARVDRDPAAIRAAMRALGELAAA